MLGYASGITRDYILSWNTVFISGLKWEREIKASFRQFVGGKAKGRISKRVLQENKGHQIFRKTNISYLLIRTRMCAYQGVRNVCFSEWRALFSCNTRFEIRPFALLPTSCVIMTKKWHLRSFLPYLVPLYSGYYYCAIKFNKV